MNSKQLYKKVEKRTRQLGRAYYKLARSLGNDGHTSAVDFVHARIARDLIVEIVLEEVNRLEETQP